MNFLATADQEVPPDVLLLDWNLPRVHGKEVLRAVGTAERLEKTLRIVLTSSDSPRDRMEVERLGAVFVSKPRTLDEFMQIGSRVKSILTLH